MNINDLLKESLRTIDKMDGDPLAQKIYERENPSLAKLLEADDSQWSEEDLVDYMKSIGSLAVSDLKTAFGGEPSYHEGRLNALVKSGVLKKSREGKLFTYSLAESDDEEDDGEELEEGITARDLERTLGNDSVDDTIGLEKLVKELNGRVTGHRDADQILSLANRVLKGHGVEALKSDDAFVDSYFRDTIALYVNMGDTYAPTVVYDTSTGEFEVTSWGDFMEYWERENGSLDEARKAKAMKQKGGTHVLVRQKKTDAADLVKGRLTSKTSKSKLQRKRKEKENARDPQFKLRQRSLERAKAKRKGAEESVDTEVELNTEVDLEEAQRRRKVLKKKGGTHVMTRQKKTAAGTLVKGRIKSKQAASKLTRKRKNRKNLRDPKFKLRQRSLARAKKRFESGKNESVNESVQSKNSDLLSRITNELNESAPRHNNPNTRTTPIFGGVTPLRDSETSFGYARDASTAPRQTVTFGSPIMPYLDNLSLSGELAGKLAEMSRDGLVGGKLLEFKKRCEGIVSTVEADGYTDSEYDSLRGTAFEASEIITTALRQFEEQGYFNVSSVEEAISFKSGSGGEDEYAPQDGDPDRIAALRKMAFDFQGRKVEGQMVDANSARLIVQIYDGLSDKNKAAYLKKSVDAMAAIAWKLASK